MPRTYQRSILSSGSTMKSLTSSTQNQAENKKMKVISSSLSQTAATPRFSIVIQWNWSLSCLDMKIQSYVLSISILMCWLQVRTRSLKCTKSIPWEKADWLPTIMVTLSIFRASVFWLIKSSLFLQVKTRHWNFGHWSKKRTTLSTLRPPSAPSPPIQSPSTQWEQVPTKISLPHVHTTEPSKSGVQIWNHTSLFLVTEEVYGMLPSIQSKNLSSL